MGGSFWVRGLAFVLAVCGIILLQAAWRRRDRNGLRLAGGWSAICLSVFAWAFTSHPDKGAALGITAMCAVALAALGLTYVRAVPRPARAMPERITEYPRLGAWSVLRRIFAGLLIGPVGALSALALSTLGFALLARAGVEHTINLVIAMFAFPLLWAVLAVLAGIDTLLWRKSLVVLGTGLVSLAYLTLAS